MSFSVVPKGQGKNKNKGGADKKVGSPPKGKAAAAVMSVQALSTLHVKENGKEVLTYNIADQKNHVGKNFTNEEDKQYTVFVKQINPDAVTLSVKGPGVFDSKALTRSPVTSAAASPSTASILGFEFSLTDAKPVKKATGLM